MQAIKSPTKPTKQRKMIYQAPDHIRYKLFAAPLSSELKVSQKTRSVPVRSGDTVRVMRGDHKGFEGKISRVDREKYRVYIEGLTREKGDGTTIFVPVHPSKVMITKLNLDDKWRKKILERKKEGMKRVEEVIEKPAPKKVPKMTEIVETKEKPAEEKAVVEEKAPETKLRKPRRKVAKKPATEKVEKKAKEPEKEAKPKTTRKRATRKTAKKTAETEGGT